jgi:succinoglycan biosynthesis transport protein ExoP
MPSSVPAALAEHSASPWIETSWTPRVEESAGSLHDYLRIVRRYRLLIVALVGGALILAALVGWIMPRGYTAYGMILIEAPAPQALSLKDLEAEPPQVEDDYYYETQYQVLKSRSLAQQVIQELGLRNSPSFAAAVTAGDRAGTAARVVALGQYWPIAKAQRWISRHLGYTWRVAAPAATPPARSSPASIQSRLIDLYLARLQVAPQQRSHMVAVSFSDPDAVLAAAIVNAHIRAYVRRGFELHAQMSKEARKFLAGKLVELKDRLANSEQALNNFRRASGTVAFSLDDREKSVMQRFNNINAELNQVANRRIALEAQNELIRRGQEQELPEVIGNPVVQQLQEHNAVLSERYAQMASRFNLAYHPLFDLAVELAEARRRLRQEIHFVTASVQAAYLAELAKERGLDRELADLRGQVVALNDAALQDAVLAREVDINNQLYKSVLERIKEIGVAAEVPLSNVSVVDWAEVPLKPTTPRIKLILAISAFLSLFGGLGLAFILNHLSDRFDSPHDVERYLRLPRLGMVPDFRQLGSRSYVYSKTRPRASADGPAAGAQLDPNEGEEARAETMVARGSSLAAEVYRSIRTALLLSRPGETPPRNLMITSAGQGEGKTVTAINLGLAFAQMGSRALLVDSDLRASRCHQVLGVDHCPGLSEVLRDNLDPARAIHATVGGLALMPAGAPPPDPSALLGSRAMREVLAVLAQRYDYILLDCAPTIAVSDAAILSTLVDGVVMVVGRKISRRLAVESCSRLGYVRARMLGVVMNQVEPTGLFQGVG